MNDHQVGVNVSVSLKEIYDLLCSDCQARLLDYIAGKAGSAQLREGLRRSLEDSNPPRPTSPAHPEPVEGPP